MNPETRIPKNLYVRPGGIRPRRGEGGREAESVDVGEKVGSPWGMGRGVRWRIALSIVAFFGLIIFIIVWLFFFAIGFNVYQNIAIIIVAFLAFFGVEAAMWATMWMRWGRVW